MFKINRTGYNYTHASGISVERPNGSSDYLLICFRTPTEVICNNEAIQLYEPCLILFDKGSPQIYHHLEIPFVNDFIHFDIAANQTAFIKELELPLNTPIFIQNIRTISSRIQNLMHEFYKKGNHSEEIIDLGLRALLYSLSDIYHDESKLSEKLNRYRGVFNEIRSEIYSYKEGVDMNVDQYAHRLSLSTSYFQHIYKKLYGVPVTHDLIQSRIDYACTLLLSNYDSIIDISRRCGYESPEHFTRQFKSVTGMSPRKYRSTLMIE